MIATKLLCLDVLLLLISFSMSDTCGKEGGKASRISGGSTARPNKYPWMVHFQYRIFLPGNKKSDMFGCGGSIISTRHVLTAKHCTEAKKNEKWDKFMELKVGVHDIFDEEDYEAVEIEKAIYPPWDMGRNDMAILVLKEPLDLSDPALGKVCLPKSMEEDYTGEPVTSMGWGMVGFGDSGQSGKNHFLKDVNLEVSGRKKINYIFTKAKKVDGVHQDPCSGDSGGPLIHKKNGIWTIIGTVNGAGYDCIKGELSTYASGEGRWNKVTSHLKWIKSVIDGDTGRDYTDHTNIARCRGRDQGDQDCCSPDHPCKEREGDCDSDADCVGDLVCRKDNCNIFGLWFQPNDDCCQQTKKASP